MVGGSSPSCPATNLRFNMEKFKNYINQAKAELYKIIFPTSQQVRTAFITVLVVVAIISIFLALIDLLMSFSIPKIV
ncbi:preprotein translocase subunit SecE [Campylobacter sp. FMV-PI01]|uniref:Protein translocase subunit SecE n=1 Tax=Campylobacter portucalensis TaxID=2608384 RepID=A0A6L5WH57_9BACT|nr:preprotein translocase subunit SecE [Campylobacter portucalensis]MSN96374.1 preprotein translocase subunit SecE [Campylobacter portucalensis]